MTTTASKIPETPSTFRAELFTGVGDSRIVLTGELDLADAPVLARAVRLAQEGDVPFVVDCRNLTFVDTAGIRALLRAVSDGGRVTGLHGSVLRALTIAEVHQLLVPQRL